MLARARVNAGREMLTGNGLACMDDKDVERFDQAFQQQASLVGTQILWVSNLCA